jgi:DNA-binding winged helix-turn-helix (wHTH) protein
VPWVQPWGTAAVKAPLGLPRIASTQRRHSGINVLILWGAVIEHGFAGQSWLTFRQALIAEAARLLLPHPERGRRIDAAMLRAAMERSFGGSDAEGAWDWKTAYDSCEAATVLCLRKFGPAMRARGASPATMLPMLAKIAMLLPTHTRRSEESQAFQQFSTPIALGLAASSAAAITPADLVLEPSAGTGLLAILAELAGGALVLNELATPRAGLLGRLFPGVTVSRFDAAQINDHLGASIRPSVVLKNLPFSAMAHVERRMADTTLRHVTSALARLADGGRLVAITGANFAGWRLDVSRRELRSPANALVDLRAAEFDVLLALVEHPQRVSTRDQLLDLARGRSSDAFDRTIDLYISRLRHRLEADPKEPALIKTVRSEGYIFTSDVTLNGAPW